MDGKKIVAVAVTGTVAVLGIAQIYLPYVADRDKLRGLFEEEYMPPGAKREMEAMMKAQRQAARQPVAPPIPAEAESSLALVDESKGQMEARSMWSNLRRSQSGQNKN